MRLVLFSAWILMPLLALADSLPQVSQKIDLELKNQWTLRQQIRKLNPNNDRATLETTHQFQLDNNINGLPLFTQSLLIELDPQQNNDTLENDYRWKYAALFSPHDPAPHALLCRWQKDPKQLNSVLYHCLHELGLQLKHPRSQLYLLAMLNHALYMTFFIVLIALVISFMIKYTPFLLQYYSSKIHWLSPLAFAVILGMVLFMLTFTFGWLVGLCAWTLVLWRFIHRLEKYLWIVLQIGVIFLPVLFHVPALFIAKTKYATTPPYTLEGWMQSWGHHSEAIYNNAFQTFFSQTFHQPSIEFIQVTVLVTVILQFILASTTKISDFYFVYEEKERFTKKTIIKELRPYQKLYFKYLHSLNQKHRRISILYNVFIHHHWIDKNKPLVAVTVLTGWAFCLSMIWISYRYAGPDIFHWGILFSVVLLIIYICVWRTYKHVKDQDLYEKK